MKRNRFVVAAWVWWTLAVEPGYHWACASAAVEDGHMLCHEDVIFKSTIGAGHREGVCPAAVGRRPPHRRVRFNITYDTTGDDYGTFIEELRGRLYGGSDSNGIPLLRREATTPISHAERFVLVELTNPSQQSVTLAIDVVNVYVVGYQARERSYFFPDAPPGASSYLFTGTNHTDLQFNNSYGEMEGSAGTQSRSEIHLGACELIMAVRALYFSSNQRHQARYLIVAVQMVSEAARYRLIEHRVRQAIETGISFQPDSYMMELETSFRRLSNLVQRANPDTRIFSTSETLQTSPRVYTVLCTVGDVISIIAVLLFDCRNPRPPSSLLSTTMIINPVVEMAGEYMSDDICPSWEPTARIVGRDGLCVAVKHGLYLNGVALLLSQCESNTDPSQLWTFKSDGTIRSKGMCMTTYGFEPGHYVMIYDCDKVGHNANLWKIKDDGTIMSSHPELVLTADSGSVGTELKLQMDISASRQGWVVSNYTEPREVSIVGYGDICLEENEAAVWSMDCAGDNVAQKWALYADGSIRPKQNKNQCLTVDGDSPSTFITVASCSSGSPGQRWVFKNNGAIMNLNSNLAMDVSVNQIIINEFNGSPNQKWLPVP